MTAIELINDFIVPLEPANTVFEALKLMDENKIGHLPITKDKKYLGVISDNDLYSVDDENKTIGTFYISPQRIYVNQFDHYYSALKVLAENKISLVPVIDDSGLYLGSIVGVDLVHAAADTLSVKNPGGVIILHIQQNDFSLSEISRIVESNDCKILSAGINTLPNSNILQITLKLNNINIEPVLQTLTRFEYNINAYYGENKKDEDILRDRYDALMMYLNV